MNPTAFQHTLPTPAKYPSRKNGHKKLTGRPTTKIKNGYVFGYLHVIYRLENRSYMSNGHDAHLARWMCRCVCGKECVVFAQNLRKGLSRTCGSKECRRAIKLDPGFVRRKVDAERAERVAAKMAKYDPDKIDSVIVDTAEKAEYERKVREDDWYGDGEWYD
jgi:hypothetical protein